MPKKRPEQRFNLGKTTVLESANQGPLVGRPFRVTRREMALFGHADWEGRLVKAGGRLPKVGPNVALRSVLVALPVVWQLNLSCCSSSHRGTCCGICYADLLVVLLTIATTRCVVTPALASMSNQSFWRLALPNHMR